MADPNKAFLFVMSNECRVRPDGSFDDATITDTDGGKTRFGIDSKSHPEALGDGFYSLPYSDALGYASDLFKYDYFSQIIGYQIADQVIATKFSDMAFNEGIMEATKIVQRAVNSLRETNQTPLAVDGKPGIQTIAAINATDEKALLTAIISYGTQFYSDLHCAHPEKYSDAVYEAWITRLQKIPSEVTT